MAHRRPQYTPVPATLPEELCHIFPERLHGRTAIQVPASVTDIDCHPRMLALWFIEITAIELSQRFVPQTAAAGSISRNLNRAARWRERNGIINVYRAGKSYDAAVRKASTLFTPDQFYFGVSGTIDYTAWNMTPPVDHDTKQGVLAGPVTATYPLPVPQDLSREMQIALLANGYNLPSFAVWLS